MKAKPAKKRLFLILSSRGKPRKSLVQIVEKIEDLKGIGRTIVQLINDTQKEEVQNGEKWRD